MVVATKPVPKGQTSVRVKPVGDRLVIRPIKQAEKTKGGLFIPEVAKETQQEGEVVAVGEGRYTEQGAHVPMQRRVGERVLYGKYSGVEVEVDGEPVLIVREGDVLAVLEYRK